MVLHLVVIFAFSILLYFLKCLLTKNHDYWLKRNVPHLKPLPLFGNHIESMILKKHVTQVTYEICKQFPTEPYIGSLFGTRPTLIVQDPDLVKLVLSKDFYYFSGRDCSDYSEREPVTKTLFFTSGDKWKIQRQNLTPLYSSAKIKGMFYLIKDCVKQLERLLEEDTKIQPYIDVKVLFERYTIDCISTCGFGFNSNTMKTGGETNPFMIIRENIFDTSIARGLKLNCRIIWPSLFYALRLRLFDNKLFSFFHKLLIDIFNSRQTDKSSRNDFVDLILTWREKSCISGARLGNKYGVNNTASLEVNDELLVGQCVLFFGAGYETTATALSFLLYELAKHKEIQDKLIAEVDCYFKKKNGEIEYECINELPYLEACIDESLRMYPVLGVLTRDVMEDYTFPTGLRIQKGDLIHIPVTNIHYNPDHYPEPEKFRPERFYGEERKNIKPFTFLSFGEGPRMCIGQRFSKMPMFAGLLAIFRRYRIELADDMPHTLELEATSIVITPTSGINVKFISRN
ncbi:cytochrome P450 6B5-like [Bicyclus anynana]|uniref:unspecific monooxygenase n=1 Tax=Bicyclus anynana TaxID=110368 RepID=A0ABM3LJ11_BICAN|nr:cytochrome P450 6B5-like [Bicyclus anynana]